MSLLIPEVTWMIVFCTDHKRAHMIRLPPELILSEHLHDVEDCCCFGGMYGLVMKNGELCARFTSKETGCVDLPVKDGYKKINDRLHVFTGNTPEELVQRPMKELKLGTMCVPESAQA